MPRKTGISVSQNMGFGEVTVNLNTSLLSNGVLKTTAITDDGANISHIMDKHSTELERIRAANELILGQEVDEISK